MDWLYSHFAWTFQLRGLMLIPYCIYLCFMVITFTLALFGAFASDKFSIIMWVILLIEIMLFFLVGFVV